MLALSKILVPVDFSKLSTGVVMYARNLACHFHSELTLLHVLPPIPYAMGAFEFGGVATVENFAERMPEARQQLGEFLADELIGVKVRRIVLEGDAALKIVEHAHETNVDLITMPTHGYGPFRRFLLGSVTAKVLHDADCPVLTGVHLEQDGEMEPAKVNSIICSVDLGPQSAKAFEWASQMAETCHAGLIVVHAMPLGDQHCEEMFDPEWRTTVEERIRERLAELAAGIQTAAVVIEAGNPAEVVATTAERFDAQLVVIGRSEAGGMFGRLRTNSYAIIRQSPCPVVSV